MSWHRLLLVYPSTGRGVCVDETWQRHIEDGAQDRVRRQRPGNGHRAKSEAISTQAAASCSYGPAASRGSPMGSRPEMPPASTQRGTGGRLTSEHAVMAVVWHEMQTAPGRRCDESD